MDFLSAPTQSYRPYLSLSLPFLVKATVVFIGGIVAAYHHIPLLLLLPFGLGIHIYIGTKNPHLLKTCIMLSCFFIAGFGRMFLCLAYQTSLFPLYHVSLEAAVESITPVDGNPWRYQTLLSVKKIFHDGAWKVRPCTIQLYSTKKPHCLVADLIHCSVEKVPAPEGDFKLYLFKEGIDATAFQPMVQIKILHRPSTSFKRWASKKRDALYRQFSQKLSPSTFALFSSLFLGNRTTIKQQLEPQKPQFKTWGISHFLARSGVHLLIFILLLSALLSLVPLPFSIKHLILFFCALLYAALSWPSISFNRALYTFVFCKIATLRSIPLHSMHTLALVCLLLLVISPLQIFFLDFQLTFLLTFCLMWIAQLRHQRKLTFSQRLAK